jgi:uncharacterized protein (TIGR03382 family)
MGIVNRRNAVVGWLTLKVGKRVVKQKAADAVPKAKKTGGAAAGALAAVGGVLLFWRRKRGGGTTDAG